MSESRSNTRTNLACRHRWGGLRSTAVMAALLFSTLGLSTAEAQITVSTNWQDYAILGQSAVLLDSYSAALGDVYAGGDLTLEFAYGVQRPSQTVGNMVTRGNFFEDLSGQITGNVSANGNVTLYSGCDVTGNVQYGGTIACPDRTQITGTMTKTANSVPLVALPTAHSFTAGTQDISVSSDLTLLPGSYGNLTASGYSKKIVLSSGDYYLKSFNTGSNNVCLDLTNGPVRVFVQGDITFASGSSFSVNGAAVNNTNVSLQRTLASNVLFESHGKVNINNYSGSCFGTIFAPSGQVTLDMQDLYGSILAGGAVSGNVYVQKQTWNADALPMVMLSGQSATIIAGGAANMSATLGNSASAGTANLDYSLTAAVQTGVATLQGQFPATGSLAPGASQVYTFSAASDKVGVTTIKLSSDAPSAFNASDSIHATLTVLDHAAPVLSATATNFGRVMLGAAIQPTTKLTNTSASYRAGLQITDLGGFTGALVGDVIANGGNKVLNTPALDTSRTGPISASYTIALSDDQKIPGATARPSQTFTASATVLDNRRVTVAENIDLGYIHLGGTLSSPLTLTTTGDDSRFTRIAVSNSAADANGIAVSGGNAAYRFGLDGMSDTRSIGGTPNTLGALQGAITLTSTGETGVTGVQTLANVAVNYSAQVYSGKAAWNATAGGSWSSHPSWKDTLSTAGGAPGISGMSGYGGDTATFGNSPGSGTALITLDGSSPTLSTLIFDNYLGGSYVVAPGSGGSITLTPGANNAAITAHSGNHQIETPLTFVGNADVTVTNYLGALGVTGNISGSGGLNKYGDGVLKLTGANVFSGPTYVAAGTLQGNVGNLGDSIVNNASVVFDQVNDATFTGKITGTGSLTKTGPGKAILAGADNVTSTGAINILQGALSMPFGMPHGGAGIVLGSSGTLEAAGSIVRIVSGSGTVTAIDDLVIGRSSQASQFNLGGAPGLGGTLNIGRHAVVVLSSSQAILGSQTNLDEGGSLTTLYGSQLGNAASVDSTRVLTASGNATINGDFLNNGLVKGPIGAGAWLTFTQDVSGAGSTTGNVLYAGSYSPGNSRAAVSAQNIAFDAASRLIMEIGGLRSGDEYDQLDVSGLAMLDGTLDVACLNGYTLQPGESYKLIDGATTGQFDQVVGLPEGWHVSYDAGGVTVVPEPSTLALLGIGLLGLFAAARKRRAG